jgi:hypothetical protein
VLLSCDVIMLSSTLAIAVVPIVRLLMGDVALLVWSDCEVSPSVSLSACDEKYYYSTVLYRTWSTVDDCYHLERREGTSLHR